MRRYFPALMSATAVAFIGFTGVVLTTPFWKEHAELSIGLLVGLLILEWFFRKLINLP